MAAETGEAAKAELRRRMKRQLKDMAKAKPFMDRCVTATATEPGCIYYGWTVSEDGTKMMCRETYVDGAAAS